MSDLMGEFRGWLDRFEGSGEAADVLAMYQRVAEEPSAEVRAYCVREGLRRGVIELTFGYEWWDDRGIVALNTALGCGSSILRPFVAPSEWRRGPRDPVVDVFPSWLQGPRAFRNARYGECHETHRAQHMDAYFDHFSDIIDRRSLLMRGEPCK